MGIETARCCRRATAARVSSSMGSSLMSLFLLLLALGSHAYVTAEQQMQQQQPDDSSSRIFAFLQQPLPRRVCNAACQRAQSAALTQLHARLGGAGWANADGYGVAGLPHCSWFGVICCVRYTKVSNAYLMSGAMQELPLYNLTCATDGGVVGLQLQDNNLNGTIDAAFAAAALAPLAPSLEYIFMRGNHIYGPLALLLRGMHNLRIASLSNNWLSGTLPSEVGQMAALTVLSVANNELRGTVPVADLLECRALTDLDLSSNYLSGVAPLGLIGLPGLYTISLDDNELDALPRRIQHAHQLPPSAARISPHINDRAFWLSTTLGASLTFQVSLRRNRIAGGVPAWLLAHPVYSLDLGQNMLSGTLPQFVGNNPWMRELQLDNNALSGTVPDSFSSPTLAALILSDNKFVGPLPPSIGSAASIREYRVSGNQLTGTLPACYANLYVAETVDLHSNRLQVGAGLPPWLQQHSKTLVAAADASGELALLCPVITFTNHTTTIDLSPSYYSWQGCTCNSDGAELVFHGDGQERTATCVQPPDANGLPTWAIATTVVLTTAGAIAAVLLAGFLAVRLGLGGAIAHHRAHAAKRRPPGGGGEVTLVLTDVQGSTELMEWDADVTTDAIALHDRLMRSFMTRFYGHEVSTEGDAFLVAFHEPFDAAAWCLAVQLSLMCVDWPDALLQHDAASVVMQEGSSLAPPRPLFRGLRVRMAVATGGVEAVSSGVAGADAAQHKRQQLEHPSLKQQPQHARRDAYRGPVFDAVHALEGLAHGGQVLLDAPTFAGVRARLPELGAAAVDALGTLAGLSPASAALVDALADHAAAELMTPPSQPRLAPASATELLDATARSGALALGKARGGSSNNGGGSSTMLGGRADEEAAVAAAAAAATPSLSNMPRERLPSWRRRRRASVVNSGGGAGASAGAGAGGGGATAHVSWHSAVAIDAGTHQLGCLPGAVGVLQLLPGAVQERARLLPNVASDRQLSPGYFDAPGARDAPLGLAGGGGDARAALPHITIVFCAIDGYRAMLAADADTAREALELYCSALRWLLLITGGYECDEDDGSFMVAFATAAAAVEWCLVLQQVLQDLSWPERVLELPGAEEVCDQHGAVVFRGPRVKMGLYRGRPARITPHSSSGRADYFGPLVNRAARFCHGAAHGGQVLMPRELLLQALQQQQPPGDGGGGFEEFGDEPGVVQQLRAQHLGSGTVREWPWRFAPPATTTTTDRPRTAADGGTGTTDAAPPLSPPDGELLAALSSQRRASLGSVPSRNRRSSITSSASASALDSLPASASASLAPSALAALFVGADAERTYARATASRWTWAGRLLVHDLGTFRFKGVGGEHAVVSVTAARLAGRNFPTAARSGKGERVAAGRGLVAEVMLSEE